MNNIYLYDGTFKSLCSLIIELIKLNIIPDNIRKIGNSDNSLFDQEIYLEIKKEKENIEYLKKVVSKRIIGSIYYVFLSENKNKEFIIYEFIKNAMIYKDKVYYYRKLDCVNEVIKISGYVSKETHKLKGFLRFKEMENNFYYAKMSPTNNIISLLGKHFQKRLQNETFIICDEKRKIYLIHYNKKIIYLYEKDIIKLNLTLGKSEEYIESLWKTFHKTIAIKERKNIKTQMNFMPKKYWNNIIEMEDKI